MTTINNNFLERKMICRLTEYIKCPIEEQRYLALMLWATDFPQLQIAGRNLTVYFDQLSRNATLYKPEMMFDDVSWRFGNGNILIVDTLRVGQQRLSLSVGSRSGSSSILRSRTMNISCIGRMLDKGRLEWVNFTLVTFDPNVNRITFNVSIQEMSNYRGYFFFSFLIFKLNINKFK